MLKNVHSTAEERNAQYGLTILGIKPIRMRYERI